MSAFMCGKAHFQAIADSLATHAINERSSLHWATVNFLLSDEEFRRLEAEEAEELAIKVTNKLMALNALSIETRYGEGSDMLDHLKDDKVHIVTRVNSLSPMNKVAFLKALGCLRYQCAEDIADEQPLFHKLTKFIGQAAEGIIMDSEAYDKAQWEIVTR